MGDGVAKFGVIDAHRKMVARATRSPDRPVGVASKGAINTDFELRHTPRRQMGGLRPTPVAMMPPPDLRPDDLKSITGIGPAVNGLLNSAGIHTFVQLADQSEQSLRALLRRAGLTMIDPAQWPERARLAAAEVPVTRL